MRCQQCNYENESSSAVFCDNCGTRLNVQRSDISPPATTVTQTGKKMNPNLYTISLWGGILCFLLAGSFSSGNNNAFDGLLFIIGFGAIIFSETYWLVCLYKCWSIVQGFGARTTPGKAVGYLFIPFFNFYWIFVALKGLSEDANTFSKRQEMRKEISVGLSLSICIILIIPYINMLGLPLQNILIYQWADFYNTAALSKNHDISFVKADAVV
ncbi:hypothetical protein SAMN04489760_12213 [Syntrophus gentianae]|uniref:Zinc-ribbon domain-containing protein n=1 Tax=Syntrophus gentianae TaxID=43775 RepID=A0A1H7ZCW8_9BACT|nr:zinc ribbon domain-containing protein [Syntrophus gentianae]SEM55834.1 hypothetical protein SAMN04489760_12213 [Syntrophus gentianae]